MNDSFATAVARKFVREINSDSSTRNLTYEEMLDVIKAIISMQKAQSIEPIDGSKILTDIRRFAAPNPLYIEHFYGIRPKIFLINSHSGSLKSLVNFMNSVDMEFSYSIIYGEWDAVVIIWATDLESEQFYKKISSQNLYIVSQITVSSTIRVYGLQPRIEYDKNFEISRTELNSVISDREISELIHDEFIEAGVLLGDYYSMENGENGAISAYIGLTLVNMIEDLQHDVVLERLMENHVIRKALVDMYEIQNGRPFHYFLKLEVDSLSALDEITNHIGFLRIGRTKCEGITFVVASELVKPLAVTEKDVSLIADSPVLDGINEIAMDLLSNIGPSAASDFNNLDPSRQLSALKAIFEIEGALNTEPDWDSERESELRHCASTLSIEVLRPEAHLSLVGPALEVGTSVERYAKRILRQVVDVVYDKNYARAQKELKLPSRDFRKLSIGKTANALSLISIHDDFREFREVLQNDMLARMQAFSEQRNRWAHGAMHENYSVEQRIDDVKKMMLEGISVCRWLGGISAVAERLSRSADHQRASAKTVRAAEDGESLDDDSTKLHVRRQGRVPGVFLSHSTKDKVVAERIAKGIEALGLSIWYSDWSLRPGDSIVSKIESALAANDKILLLLSKNSVASNWVKKEINTAVMDQLSGENISIIPIIIGQCEIPISLREIRYIDMSLDFEEGLIELLNHLRQKK